MRWPAARITAPDQRATRRVLVFAAAELVLAMAIPFILIHGYHTLLSSNAGTFVNSPTVTEPGWSALVAATPLTAVVEVVDGGVSGAALIVPPGDIAAEDDGSASATSNGHGSAGGTVVLVPGDLSIPDGPTGGSQESTAPPLLSDVAPTAAGDALAALLNVDVASVEVMTESAWAEVLADARYELDNPDPVPLADAAAAADTESDTESDTAEAGAVPAELAFAVGPVSVGGADAAVFLGRPVDGGSLSSVMPRRKQFWSALVNAPPSGTHPLVVALQAVGPAGQIIELPTSETPEALTVDAAAAEDLLRDIVAFPSGNRLEIRLVDRSGDADLSLIAAQLAGRGIEVVEIANAVQFDEGSTELIRPTELGDGVDQFNELVDELGVEPIVDPEQEHDTVTLLVGNDLRLVD